MAKKNYDAWELQQKINDIDSSINTINSSLGNYVTKVSGKGLSTNDFTNAYKAILDSLTTTINDAISTAIVNNNKATHPLHSSKITFNNVNPSTYITGTTWELVAQGKTLVGVDENDTDFNVAGKTGGSKTHTLTVQELVPHKHKSMTLGIGNGGYKVEGQAGAGQVGTETNYIGEATTVSLDEKKTAQAQAFSIMPPYVTVYIWERTA